METPQQSNKLLTRGIIGSIVAAVCCFTPILVFAFVGVGLSGLVGGIDYVVFPVMFASLGVVAQALYIRTGRPGASPKTIIAVVAAVFAVTLIWLEFRYALRISLAAVALVAIYGLYLSRNKAQTAS